MTALTWLAEELMKAGLDVIEHDGWRTRTLRSFDEFTPVGLINHHTAGSSVLPNYPDLPFYRNESLEEKCNLTIRPDGVVVCLNAGYAADSGFGDHGVLDAVREDREPPEPTDTYIDFDPVTPGGSNPGILGNRWFIDIEVQHLGNGDPVVAVQREALIVANAVICEQMGWDPLTRVIGHREWTSRKTDPRWDGTASPMPKIRADSKQRPAITVRGMEKTMSLPISFGDQTEDVRFLEKLINDTYGEELSLSPSHYDEKTRDAVKRHLAKYTNDPEAKEGEFVNGLMFAGLLKDFVVSVRSEDDD